MLNKDINLHGICPIIREHLNTSVSELDQYIPSNNYCKILNWVPSPFQVSALEVDLNMHSTAEQLSKLQRQEMWRETCKMDSDPISGYCEVDGT